MTLMYFLSYLTIGLSLGWISRMITGNRGVEMYTSLIFGALGSLVGLAIVETVGLAGDAFFAVIGAIAILFTVNAFRQEEPIFKNTLLN